jgi:hypothetical protein
MDKAAAKHPTLDAALDRFFDNDEPASRRFARLTVALCGEIGELRLERDGWRARAEAAEAELAQADGRRK